MRISKTIWSVLIIVITLTGCSNEQLSESNISDNDLISRFNSKKELGSKHRDILEFSFNEYLVEKSKTRSYQSDIKNNNLDNIESILTDYSLKNRSKESKLNSKDLKIVLDIASIIADESPLQTRIVSNDYEIPEYIKYFFSQIKESNDITVRKVLINSLIRTESQYALSDFEKDCLASTAAIYEDSFNYWIGNYQKWEQLNTTQTRGWWGDRWNDLKRAGEYLGLADAAGAAAVYVQAGVAAVSSGGTLALPAGAAVAGAAGASSVVAGVISFF